MRGDTFSPLKIHSSAEMCLGSSWLTLLWPMQDGNSEFFCFLSLGIFLISNRVHRDDFQFSFFLYSPKVNEILCYCYSLFVLLIEEWSCVLFSRCHLSDSFSGFFKMSPWWKLPSPFSKLKLLLLLSLRGRWLKEHLKFLKACVPPTPHTVNFVRTLYRWWYSFSENRFNKIMPVFTQLSLGMLSMFLPEVPSWPCGWELCCDGLRSNLSAEVTLTLEILIKLAWAFILSPVDFQWEFFEASFSWLMLV